MLSVVINRVYKGKLSRWTQLRIRNSITKRTPRNVVSDMRVALHETRMHNPTRCVYDARRNKLGTNFCRRTHCHNLPPRDSNCTVRKDCPHSIHGDHITVGHYEVHTARQRALLNPRESPGDHTFRIHLGRVTLYAALNKPLLRPPHKDTKNTISTIISSCLRNSHLDTL